MIKPYCIVDGTEYQLYYKDNRLVFPEIRITPDLNKLWIDYLNGEITLKDIFNIYATIGCSYYFVFNYFAKSGCYGSAKKPGDYLKFELFTDDEEINEEYNNTHEDDLRVDIENILNSIIDDIHDLDKNTIINKLEKCVELLNKN
jgi:hypothetical protein